MLVPIQGENSCNRYIKYFVSRVIDTSNTSKGSLHKKSHPTFFNASQILLTVINYRKKIIKVALIMFKHSKLFDIPNAVDEYLSI